MAGVEKAISDEEAAYVGNPSRTNPYAVPPDAERTKQDYTVVMTSVGTGVGVTAFLVFLVAFFVYTKRGKKNWKKYRNRREGHFYRKPNGGGGGGAASASQAGLPGAVAGSKHLSMSNPANPSPLRQCVSSSGVEELMIAAKGGMMDGSDSDSGAGAIVESVREFDDDGDISDTTSYLTSTTCSDYGFPQHATMPTLTKTTTATSANANANANPTTYDRGAYQTPDIIDSKNARMYGTSHAVPLPPNVFAARNASVALSAPRSAGAVAAATTTTPATTTAISPITAVATSPHSPINASMAILAGNTFRNALRVASPIHEYDGNSDDEQVAEEEEEDDDVDVLDEAMTMTMTMATTTTLSDHEDEPPHPTDNEEKATTTPAVQEDRMIHEADLEVEAVLTRQQRFPQPSVPSSPASEFSSHSPVLSGLGFVEAEQVDFDRSYGYSSPSNSK